MLKNSPEIDRRLFLARLCAAAATTASIRSGLKAEGRSPVIQEDAPNTHNMLVFGEKNLFINQASKRIREAQQVAGQIQTADPKRPSAITLKAGQEIYFEEGELLMPPTFDDTQTEKAKT